MHIKYKLAIRSNKRNKRDRLKRELEQIEKELAVLDKEIEEERALIDAPEPSEEVIEFLKEKFRR